MDTISATPVFPHKFLTTVDNEWGFTWCALQGKSVNVLQDSFEVYIWSPKFDAAELVQVVP